MSADPARSLPIAEKFEEVILAIHHQRIEYPDTEDLTAVTTQPVLESRLSPGTTRAVSSRWTSPHERARRFEALSCQT